MRTSRITTKTKKRKRRKMRKTSGSDRSVLSLILTVIVLLGLLAAAPAAFGKHKKKAPAEYAIVAGTVFRDPGFALGGAEVILTAAPGEHPAVKIRKQRFVCGERGEFAFHVPAVPLDYNVSVRAKGFVPQHKKVKIQGDERIDVTFELEQESKK
jgi:Carboxypeptidase regulatory-like domain